MDGPYEGTAVPHLLNNIVFNNTGVGLVIENDYYNPPVDSSIPIICCNFYDNDGGNYVGFSDQTGLNGNISSNPQFCDTANGYFNIRNSSSC